MTPESTSDYYGFFDGVDPNAERNHREEEGLWDAGDTWRDRFYDEHDDLERQWYGEDDVFYRSFSEAHALYVGEEAEG